MVKFTFNTYGFAFEKGVELLLDAYLVASQALEANRQRIEADLADYEASVAAGNGVIGEREDDRWLWTKDQMLEVQIEDAGDALRALRRAFVVALYHHWERWIGRQFNKDNGNHEYLVRLAERHGLPIHPRLIGVRDLANLFKHSNKKRGLDLLISWPDLLPPHFTAETKADWYEVVRLSDELVLEVASIVRASGPNVGRAYGNTARLEPPVTQ